MTKTEDVEAGKEQQKEAEEDQEKKEAKRQLSLLERRVKTELYGMIIPFRGFKPRDGDIFSGAFPKSGTTWLDQILHQLRTEGEQETFTGDQLPLLCKWKLTGEAGKRVRESEITPRVLKTHFNYDNAMKIGR